MNRTAIAGALLVAAGALFWTQRRAQAATSASPGAAVADLARDVAYSVEDALSAITPGPWSPPDRAAPYLGMIAAAEGAHGIPRGLLARLLYQESRFRPDIIDGTTVSPAGALGIAQFMPATAAELGVDPLNPESAIDGAARYLARLRAALGDWPRALAAYNWGIGNVQRKGLDAAPEETRRYVAGILGDSGLA